MKSQTEVCRFLEDLSRHWDLRGWLWPTADHDPDHARLVGDGMDTPSPTPAQRWWYRDGAPFVKGRHG